MRRKVVTPFQNRKADVNDTKQKFQTILRNCDLPKISSIAWKIINHCWELIVLVEKQGKEENSAQILAADNKQHQRGGCIVHIAS